jgi:hypothetical protein
MDLINGLLDKDKTTRLGANGDWKQILKHPVFEGVDIEQYEKKLITPPFKPAISEQDLSKFFNAD